MSSTEPKNPVSFVPGDTIVDSGRVLRKPIDEWACHLLALIRSCSRKRPGLETIGQGCSALNNAALVFVHAGLPEVAAGICQSQMDWIDKCRAVFSEAELSVLAIQPWVNLGRLCRRARSYDRALQYFLVLDTGHERKTAQLGQWVVPISDSFREAAEPLYVYESLRTHLQSGDLDRAIDFAHGLDKFLLRSSLMLRTELLIHVSLRQNKHHQVAQFIREMPWPENQFGVMAKYFYTSLALNAIAQPQSCAKALDRVAHHLISYVSRPEVDSRDVRFAIEVCKLAGHLGLGELFVSMLSATCTAVLRAGDVPFASQLLHLRKSHGSFGALEELTAVEEFVMHSGYSAFSIKSLSPRVVETLTELRYAIAQLLCDPVSNPCA